MTHRLLSGAFLTAVFLAGFPAGLSAPAPARADVPQFQGYTADMPSADPFAAAPVAAGLELPEDNDLLKLRETGASGMSYRPAPTTPQDIAIVYHRIIGEMPNIEQWATESDAYQNATTFDRPVVLEQQVGELRNLFHIYSFGEPLVIATPVDLSVYHPVRKGFIVDSFREDTFFTFHYAGDDYAIVVPHLTDFQWLAVEGPAARRIEEARNGPAAKRGLTMLLYVEPKAADKAPMEIDGKKYKLISAEVSNMALYAARGTTALWERNSARKDEENLNELRGLYR